VRAISAAAVIALIAFGLPLMASPVPAKTTSAIPNTTVTINGGSGDRVYRGLGAILGGGGEARYLEEYPASQRKSILKYLFKPEYGASLQLLKLEIGGDGNSTIGSEPSIEHAEGHVNCDSGYEFTVARQARKLNPRLKLYGLQWGAPGWVGQNGSLFTQADIRYLLDWLGCAHRHGLKINYLGGWNERDDGSHADWFHSLRAALDRGGYRSVEIVAGDNAGSHDWAYVGDKDVAMLGAHDNCGYPTGVKEARTRCSSPAAPAKKAGQPLLASELGAVDGNAGSGCAVPCAPAMARAFLREYIDARVVGALEWPALVSMPAHVLPYENRGLVTADQPWSGHYKVNAMTWVTAQITQFAWLPTHNNPGGWRYLDSASGYLRGNRTHGSYVTLVRGTHDEWSTIIETTAGVTKSQHVTFHIKGGHGLASKTVHVWASGFSSNTGPSHWFVRKGDITPHHGRFTVTVKPRSVYSFTTTTGQRKGSAHGPASRSLKLPYSNKLAAGPEGMPHLLAAQDGSYQIASCDGPDGATACTKQTAVGQPVLWAAGTGRHPYAIIGGNWSDYRATVHVLLPQTGSAGLIGRYHAVAPSKGTFDGYVFDVSTDGTFRLGVDSGGRANDAISGQSLVTPPRETTLATGRVDFAAGAWHKLALTVAGSAIRASVDGRQVVNMHNSAVTHGLAGIETGGWYPAYYSHLSITKP
jgi:hypothetical protein